MKKQTKKDIYAKKKEQKWRTKQGVAVDTNTKEESKRESIGLPPWLLWTSKVSAK